MGETTFRERFKDASPTGCGCHYEEDYPVGRWLIPRGHPAHNGYFGGYINRYVFEDQADCTYYQKVSAWRLKNKDPFGLPKEPRCGWFESFRSLWRDTPAPTPEPPE